MKKTMLMSLVGLIVMSSAMTPNSQNRKMQPPLFLSMVQLISNPNTYNGKPIRVIGYVSLSFEGTALYLHSEDYKNRITKNGLWLSISRDELNKYKSLEQKCVLIEGIFDSTQLGHRELYSGAIKSISRIEVYTEN